MKKFLSGVIILLIIISSCERKPYVEHKMQITDRGEECRLSPQEFKMVSNFGGERYEFTRCLPPDFAKDQVEIMRKGDTVHILFPVPGGVKTKTIFDIVVDIDSYPRYNFLTVDGETFSIVYSGKD
jgi:hypothetical protein